MARSNADLVAWAGYGCHAGLTEGTHIRVGFEDAIHHPGGHIARSNADLVAWAAEAAREAGRRVATFAEARSIVGCGSNRTETGELCWPMRQPHLMGLFSIGSQMSLASGEACAAFMSANIVAETGSSLPRRGALKTPRCHIGSPVKRG